MPGSFAPLDFVKRALRDLGVLFNKDVAIRPLPERVYDRIQVAPGIGATVTSSISAITNTTIVVPNDEDWLFAAVTAYSNGVIDAGDAQAEVDAWIIPRDQQGRLCCVMCSSNRGSQRDTILATNRKLVAYNDKPWILEHGDSPCIYANGGGTGFTGILEFLAYRYPRGMAPWPI